jgi:ribonuclease E
MQYLKCDLSYCILNFIYVCHFTLINMSYKLIILENTNLALIYHNNQLSSIFMEHKIYPINKIYLGKISNTLPSLGAAFIQLDKLKKKNGFIQFDKLKKEQSKTHLQNTNKNKHFLVQVTREPVGNKGPTVSTNVSLKGTYLTLYPFQQDKYKKKNIYINISKEYIHALKCLLSPNKLPIGIKNESINADVSFLLTESASLKLNWIKLVKKSKLSSVPSPLKKEKSFIYRLVTEYKTIRFNLIHVDSFKGCVKLKKILSKIDIYKTSPEYKTIIKYHENKVNLTKHLSLDLIISDIIKPRVNLYTGGYIVIEKTEALTTIDINSGSFKSLLNSRQTSLWINYLAIYEIAKQIKLRNIGGIIVIDFIDSSNQYDQMKLLKYIDNLLKKDQTKCTIVQISELGLLELTRARHGQSIYDAFTCKCKICNGLGYTANRLSLSQPNFCTTLLDFYPIFLRNQTLFE